MSPRRYLGVARRLEDLRLTSPRDDVTGRELATRPVRAATDGTVRPMLRLGGAVAVAATLVGLLGAAWLPVAAGAGAVAWVALGRLEPSAVRRRRDEVSRDLPVAADLLAACLLAGTPLDRAVAAVGTAFEGPVAEAFERAAAVLLLGASVAEAVAPWRDDVTLAGLEPVARVLVRTESSGSAAGPAIVRLGVDVRAERRWRVDEVARRAGVRATAPLGACFLPAFVLAGVVPVVIAGARSVGLT